MVRPACVGGNGAATVLGPPSRGGRRRGRSGRTHPPCPPCLDPSPHQQHGDGKRRHPDHGERQARQVVAEVAPPGVPLRVGRAGDEDARGGVLPRGRVRGRGRGGVALGRREGGERRAPRALRRRVRVGRLRALHARVRGGRDRADPGGGADPVHALGSPGGARVGREGGRITHQHGTHGRDEDVGRAVRHASPSAPRCASVRRGEDLTTQRAPAPLRPYAVARRHRRCRGRRRTTCPGIPTTTRAESDPLSPRASSPWGWSAC